MGVSCAQHRSCGTEMMVMLPNKSISQLGQVALCLCKDNHRKLILSVLRLADRCLLLSICQ